MLTEFKSFSCSTNINGDDFPVFESILFKNALYDLESHKTTYLN